MCCRSWLSGGWWSSPALGGGVGGAPRRRRRSWRRATRRRSARWLTVTGWPRPSCSPGGGMREAPAATPSRRSRSSPLWCLSPARDGGDSTRGGQAEEGPTLAVGRHRAGDRRRGGARGARGRGQDGGGGDPGAEEVAVIAPPQIGPSGGVRV